MRTDSGKTAAFRQNLHCRAALAALSRSEAPHQLHQVLFSAARKRASLKSGRQIVVIFSLFAVFDRKYFFTDSFQAQLASCKSCLNFVTGFYEDSSPKHQRLPDNNSFIKKKRKDWSSRRPIFQKPVYSTLERI